LVIYLIGGLVADQRNVVLIGGTGTGKTHLGIVIARSLIRNGPRGRFFNAADLVKTESAASSCSTSSAASSNAPRSSSPPTSPSAIAANA